MVEKLTSSKVDTTSEIALADQRCPNFRILEIYRTHDTVNTTIYLPGCRDLSAPYCNGYLANCPIKVK